MTGVQTCALPICIVTYEALDKTFVKAIFEGGPADRAGLQVGDQILGVDGQPFHPVESFVRSEERRVGKECRSRWSPYH